MTSYEHTATSGVRGKKLKNRLQSVRPSAFKRHVKRVKKAPPKARVQKKQILKNAQAISKIKDKIDHIFEKFEAVYAFDTQFSTYTNATRFCLPDYDGLIPIGNVPQWMGKSFVRPNINPTMYDDCFEFMVQPLICPAYWIKMWGPKGDQQVWDTEASKLKVHSLNIDVNMMNTKETLRPRFTSWYILRPVKENRVGSPIQAPEWSADKQKVVISTQPIVGGIVQGVSYTQPTFIEGEDYVHNHQSGALEWNPKRWKVLRYHEKFEVGGRCALMRINTTVMANIVLDNEHMPCSFLKPWHIDPTDQIYLFACNQLIPGYHSYLDSPVTGQRVHRPDDNTVLHHDNPDQRWSAKGTIKFSCTEIKDATGNSVLIQDLKLMMYNFNVFNKRFEDFVKDSFTVDQHNSFGHLANGDDYVKAINANTPYMQTHETTSWSAVMLDKMPVHLNHKDYDVMRKVSTRLTPFTPARSWLDPLSQMVTGLFYTRDAESGEVVAKRMRTTVPTIVGGVIGARYPLTVPSAAHHPGAASASSNIRTETLADGTVVHQNHGAVGAVDTIVIP